MSDIPREVLSEHFQKHMEGRRLCSAVFFTYQFEPGFFEAQVLPVFIDIPLSPVTGIRLVQLEDALSKLPGHVAVYYQAGQLISGDYGGAKLDISRIPFRHRTGVFHPKNVFLLVQDEKPDEGGRFPQTLIVAAMSANLTESGWWYNVEACHVEEIRAGDKTRIKDDLKSFLRRVKQRTGESGYQKALEDILAFLDTSDSRLHKTMEGRLQSHFYGGGATVTEFLKGATDGALEGLYLEVVSPFFDEAGICRPLQEMVDAFHPKETRVYLPRTESGEAECREDLFKSVAAMPGVKWGSIPKDLIRMGKNEDLKSRYVHAKVYRFFSQNPKREFWFTGSVNLTSAAHQAAGNVESGFLVETSPARRPEFWLQADEKPPQRFKGRSENGSSPATGCTCLNIRYHWDSNRAEGYWDATGDSLALQVASRGIAVGDVPPLKSRVWTDLGNGFATRLGEFLVEASLVDVLGEGLIPLQLLVQEEGMHRKPSLLRQLSAEDILRFWSLLTPEQRSELIGTLAGFQGAAGQGAELAFKAKRLADTGSLFGQFAGIFHGFAGLDRGVRQALEEDREKDANYRLFGNKHDSLGHLLEMVGMESEHSDPVNRYVMTLCARQVCREIAKDFPDYWAGHPAEAALLDARFEELKTLRTALAESGDAEMPEFLDWFERWFLHKATPAIAGPA